MPRSEACWACKLYGKLGVRFDTDSPAATPEEAQLVTLQPLRNLEENAEPHEHVRTFTIKVDPGSDTPVTIHSDDGHEPPKLLNCKMMVEPGTGMFVGVYLPFTDQVKKMVRETVYRFPTLVPDDE